VAARRRAEPTWLTRLVLDAIHTDQLREHGGLARIRDENLLESALAKPKQKRQYAARADLPALAAAYGLGLLQNHPYRDGNRRIGFLAMVTFLGVNGHDFSATEAEVVTEIVALADGRVSEDALADWIRRHSSRRRRRTKRNTADT
jgi:death-on-curing protein